VLVPRLDEILARTDPFDLAQAIDRYVSLLSGRQIKSLLLSARDRLGAYYRGEFVRLLSGRGGEVDAPGLSKVLREPWSENDLRSAFARLLKTNLRAIPLFGPAFCDAVLAYVPTDRTVAIGEERRGNGTGKALVAGGVAAVLVLIGAAGEHMVAVRTQPTPAPAAIVTVPAAAIAAPPRAHVATTAAKRVIAISSPKDTPAPTAAPTPVLTAAPTPVLTAAPAPLSQTVRHPAEPRKQVPTPPPARGVATVAIPDPTATPEPTPLDVTDMPDSYTDATPLPQVTSPPADVPRRVRLVTPTPKPPPHHKWLYRSLMHLDPFKPHAAPTP
jgi:hypothetical protein